MDRAMALAYSLYVDGLCPGCGQPRDRAYNPDSEGHYATALHTCEGCKAAAHRRKVESDRGKGSGQHLAVVDVDPHRQLRPWDPSGAVSET